MYDCVRVNKRGSLNIVRIVKGVFYNLSESESGLGDGSRVVKTEHCIIGTYTLDNWFGIGISRSIRRRVINNT